MRISTMTVFLVLMSLGAVSCVHHKGPNAHGDPKAEQAWRRAFVDNGFSYCDAQVLAQFWRVSIPDAKVRAGHKLQTAEGTEDLGKLMWTAREQAVDRNLECDLARSGISADEISLVATYWGVSIPEARVYCQEKLLWGGREEVLKWVDEARYKGAYNPGLGEGQEDDGAGYDQQALFDLYLSNFNYCDAEAVGRFWGVDTYEAKMTLGQKVKYGMPASEVKTYLIQPAYDSARQSGIAICE